MQEGGCLRDHFAAYRRQRGERHPQDKEIPPPPSAVVYLWNWFLEITRGRPIAATGQYLAIPSTEIAAWQALSGVRLQDWELEAIRQIDSCFLRIMGEKE